MSRGWSAVLSVVAVGLLVFAGWAVAHDRQTSDRSVDRSEARAVAAEASAGLANARAAALCVSWGRLRSRMVYRIR